MEFGNGGAVAARMLARVVGDLDRVEDAAGAAVIPNEIDLALRKTRVHHHRPGIDLPCGKQNRSERETVLADDHDPVAGPNAVLREIDRRAGHDGR